MKSYLAIFSISALVALLVTPLLRRFCERVGWVDEVRDDRRVHVRPIPRLGGVAIYISMACGLLVLLLLHNSLTAELALVRWKLVATFVPATLVFLLGVYDDLRGTNAPVKFFVQALAGVLLYTLGGRIEVLSIPFVGPVELPQFVGLVVTVCWVVGICNAFNLIDGIDGLAAGSAAFATMVMLAVGLMVYNPLVVVVGLAITGALIGFLRYNFNPASIFLGDSGALLIGFLLAALSVQGTQKASTVVAVAIPILACGLPLVDSSVAVARRFLSGKPLFEGDREHIHHKLLERGWSQRRVALVLYAASALLGLMAMLFVVESARTTGLVLFVVGAALILGIGHLRYHEVDELRASVRRNLGERRVRAANNLRVRRACQTLRTCKSMETILAAVTAMLDGSEFLCARAQFGYCGLVDARAPADLSPSASAATNWWWTSDPQLSPDHLVESKRYWSVRLPLSTQMEDYGFLELYVSLDARVPRLDITYVCSVFQHELTAALQRTQQAQPEPRLKLRTEHAAGLDPQPGLSSSGS